MTTIFPKWTNKLPTLLAIGAFGGLVFTVLAVWYYANHKYTRVGYMPEQPINYSHQIHVGKLGMDCRYCHTDVEESYSANVPAPSTCMNCHTVVDQISGYLSFATSRDGQSPSPHWMNRDLQLVRAAYDSGRGIEWRRVHKVPDYAHFPHAAHLKAGVSCFSCHSRIDEMPVVYQAESLAMGWCLDCHRNPEKHLVDTTQVRITDLHAVEAMLASADQRERGARLREQRKLEPPQHCGACHY